MKRIMLLAVAVASLAGAVTTSALARVDIDINVAPPAPRVVEAPPPRHGYVWAPGYWRWSGHKHVWVDGHWLKARHGRHWVAEHWEERHGRYHFEPGHWERG